jgi:hypothetical protein
MRHGDHGPHQLLVALPLEPTHERPVDLYDIGRDVLELGEAAVAGAEIVDGAGHAHGSDIDKLLKHPRPTADQRAFGELEFDHARRHAMTVKRLAEAPGEILFLEIGGKDVDRDAKLEPFRFPGRRQGRFRAQNR